VRRQHVWMDLRPAADERELGETSRKHCKRCRLTIVWGRFGAQRGFGWRLYDGERLVASGSQTARRGGCNGAVAEPSST